MSDITVKTKKKLSGAAKSKTVWLANILIVLGVIQNQTEVFTHFFTPQTTGAIVAVIGLVFNILRALTDKPLEEK